VKRKTWGKCQERVAAPSITSNRQIGKRTLSAKLNLYFMKAWHDLTSISALDEALAQSHTRPQLIFKHSTTCGISAQVHEGLLSETAALSATMDLQYLDLLAFRPVSNEVAARLGVAHQSPQAIVVWQGKAIASSSHFSVTAAKLIKAASGIQ